MVDVTSLGYEVLQEIQVSVRSRGVPGRAGGEELLEGDKLHKTYIGVYVLSSSAFGDIPRVRLTVRYRFLTWIGPAYHELLSIPISGMDQYR